MAVLNLSTTPHTYQPQNATIRTTLGQAHGTGPAVVADYLLYPLMVSCVVAVLENLTVCILIASSRNLKTATNTFVFSLCVADICFAGLILPIHCFYSNSIVYQYLVLISILIYILNLTSVTYERLVSLTNPLRYHSIITKRFALKIILIAWAIPLPYCLIPAIWKGNKQLLAHKIYMSCTLVIFLLAPLIFILFVYGRIFVEIRKLYEHRKHLIIKPGRKKRAKSNLRSEPVNTDINGKHNSGTTVRGKKKSRKFLFQLGRARKGIKSDHIELVSASGPTCFDCEMRFPNQGMDDNFGQPDSNLEKNESTVKATIADDRNHSFGNRESVTFRVSRNGARPRCSREANNRNYSPSTSETKEVSFSCEKYEANMPLGFDAACCAENGVCSKQCPSNQLTYPTCEGFMPRLPSYKEEHGYLRLHYSKSLPLLLCSCNEELCVIDDDEVSEYDNVPPRTDRRRIPAGSSPPVSWDHDICSRLQGGMNDKKNNSLSLEILDQPSPSTNYKQLQSLNRNFCNSSSVEKSHNQCIAHCTPKAMCLSASFPCLQSVVFGEKQLVNRIVKDNLDLGCYRTPDDSRKAVGSNLPESDKTDSAHSTRGNLISLPNTVNDTCSFGCVSWTSSLKNGSIHSASGNIMSLCTSKDNIRANSILDSTQNGKRDKRRNSLSRLGQHLKQKKKRHFMLSTQSDDRRKKSHVDKFKTVVAELKSSLAFAAVAFTYMFTWIPVGYMTFLEVIDRVDLLPDVLTEVSVFTIALNAVIDPLLYALLLRDFKKYAKMVFRRLCGFKRKYSR